MGLAATRRLYYDDSYLTQFSARVVELSADGRRIYLDQTAFYPSSGGQPHDLGEIAGAPVEEVVEEGERIAHLLSAPVAGEAVQCRINWTRRFDHMQQHTGQHLLSAVLEELFRAPTLGFHLGAESSTIDAGALLEPRQILEAEARANALVSENRPVAISYQAPSQELELRRAVERPGLLRIVEIEGLDRSACGGTHLRATGEIGPLLIRKLDKAHGCMRIEFLCGARAARRARADYDALCRIARVLSAPLEETPRLVGEQAQALQDAEKTRRRLALELAKRRGRELWEVTAPNAAGLRCAVERRSSGAIDEELRALAQSFSSQAQAVFLAMVAEPPALLLAVSPDSGIHAGEALKSALGGAGGRGGGNARLAQGSAPSRQALEAACSVLLPG